VVVLAAGRFQMPFATHAAMMGGNVRVGLEESLFIGRGQLAASMKKTRVLLILAPFAPGILKLRNGNATDKPVGRCSKLTDDRLF
jgi:beta-keto acid cleavage enzyme